MRRLVTIGTLVACALVSNNVLADEMPCQTEQCLKQVNFEMDDSYPYQYQESRQYSNPRSNPNSYRDSNRYDDRYQHNQPTYQKQSYRQQRTYQYSREDYDNWAQAAQGMPKYHASNGRRTFVFDPKILSWAAYDSDGNLVRTGHGVGGKGWCPDVGHRCHTKVGSFTIYHKGGAGCKSSKFPVGEGGAPMPYCMFFSGGFAVHGSPDVPNYNASHGCVRVLPPDAQWLHENFLRVGDRVIVKSY